MEKQINSPKFLRQRKFFTILPLLILPFITLIFWALGGGKTNTASANKISQKGFNMQLPDAYLKEDKPLDKLSYYEKAASDSAKLREQIKNDPYYAFENPDAAKETRKEFYTEISSQNPVSTSPYRSSAYEDPNAAKVYQKLEQLNKVLRQPPPAEKQPVDQVKPHQNSEVSSGDIDRLDQMMTRMSQSDGEDPEIQHLNAMLEKILDIQHPQRVEKKLKQLSKDTKGQVFQVSLNTGINPVSLLSSNPEHSLDSISQPGHQSNGFFSFNEINGSVEVQNGIEAVVHEKQTLMNGSIIKLRLLKDVYINGTHIPKDHFIYGTASFTGERLSIQINSIRYNHSIFPTALFVYDMDGLEGIYIPGAAARDAVKQSADRMVQGLGITALDPSLGTQAASAGIDAARSLFSRKARQIKVTVKAGYEVLLVNENQKVATY